jgi:alpha-L-fucosidase
VPEEAQRTLRGVGAWMQVNGEAIYGTTASPFTRLSWGRATQKPGTLYLMVFDWNPEGRFKLPIRNEVRSVELLGTDAKCRIARDEAGIGHVLMLPEKPVDPACTVVRIRYEGALDPLPFAVFASKGGELVLLPHDATLEGPSIKVEQVGVIGDVRHNIGYWLDPAATATWPIAVGAAQGGAFRVEAEIACADAAAGSRVKLEVEGGSAPLELTVPATGGWQSYRVVELGKIDIPLGSHRVVLRALSKPGEAVVNVRSIRLVPVK